MAPCAGGPPARYAGRRAKTFTSVLGARTLERASCHCEPCATGFCPRDAALGVAGASLSPGVLRRVGLVGAAVSFEEGHEFLRDLAGVVVPTKHVERAAETLGREIAAEERRGVEPPRADEPVAPTLYPGLDGTGVPMRASEVTGRAGKQPDGAAKTREVKLGTVWSAEGRDEADTPVRDAGSVTYSPAIERAAQRDTAAAPSECAARVAREVVRRGFERAARRIVLGDGALWICPADPRRRERRGPHVRRVHRAHPRADALPRVQGGGGVQLDGSGRGRRQGRDRHALQARRHALDRGGGRRDHRVALL